ncbi:hypothetical protein DYH55_14010 [Methylovirgula sp. 4M-Z18]|nr:hypothetical protein DYH55_14010 [Methylovirgula sp. 4M-Z18]
MHPPRDESRTQGAQKAVSKMALMRKLVILGALPARMELGERAVSKALANLMRGLIMRTVTVIRRSDLW